MRYTRKNRRITKENNAIDPAASSARWGKSAFKKYLGCAGKGGKTTNYDAELKDLEIRSMIYGRKAGATNA